MLLLWSDVAIWLMFFGMLGLVWQVIHQPTLKSSWRQVFSSHAALSSAIIIVIFLLIALADSLHWRTSDPYRPVVSLLDVSLGKIATTQEKSYSAPLAITGLWQETKTLDNGDVIREAVRLKHIPELINHNNVTSYLAQTALFYFLVGTFLTSLLLYFVRRCRYFSADIPWSAAVFTVGSIATVSMLLYGLGQSFHVLGTGKVGQDVLYETIKGVRTGMLIGGLTTLIALPFAIVMGLAAGYFRGWVDDGVQYAYTTLNAVPGVLLIASAMLLAQLYLAQHADSFASEQERADVRLLLVCVVLGLTGWTGLARILRAEALKLREMPFVQAAKAFGLSHMNILWKHLLPNIGHLVLIAVVLDFSGLVLAEAVLSYVGIGVDPTMPSWGNMINLARQELNREPIVWWNLLGAFSGMFVLVLSANLLADKVQQVFNPRAAA